MTFKTLSTGGILGLLAAFLTLSIATAQTQGVGQERLFTIYGIEIDETSRNATVARRNGLAKAEEEGFRALIARLVREEDLGLFFLPEEASASDYVLGIEVEEERNSTVRYIGTVNITFSPEKIETLLGEQNIPFIGFAPEPELVFPMLWQEGEFLLWEKENAFFDAWRGENDPNRIARAVLPEGSLQERISLSPIQILEARQENQILLALSSYGVDDYVAITARFMKSTKGEITGLEIATHRPLQELAPLVRTYNRQGLESEEDMLNRVVMDYYQGAERDWKIQALTQFGESRDLALMVPVENPGVWAEIRQRLDSAPIISGVNVARLATPETFISVTFSGTDEQLTLALRQKGLILIPAGRGFALIRQEDAARFLAERGGS